MDVELNEFEFVIYIGGIILAGSLVVTCLGLLIIAIINRQTPKRTIKQIFNEKERKNGQHKGGSRGNW